jgi:hypothetical protein
MGVRVAVWSGAVVINLPPGKVISFALPLN